MLYSSITYFTNLFSFYRMLKQFLLLIAVNQMASALFRLIAGIGRDLTIATTYGSCSIIFFVVLGGFIISRSMSLVPNYLMTLLLLEFSLNIYVSKSFFCFLCTEDINNWWIWGYWISPLSYAQNAISVNEFMGHQWDKV